MATGQDPTLEHELDAEVAVSSPDREELYRTTSATGREIGGTTHTISLRSGDAILG